MFVISWVSYLFSRFILKIHRIVLRETTASPITGLYPEKNECIAYRTAVICLTLFILYRNASEIKQRLVCSSCSHFIFFSVGTLMLR